MSTKPPTEGNIPLEIKVNFTDKGDTAPLQAFAFTHQGKLLGSAPVEQQSAKIEVPADLNGRTVEVILGPRVEKGQPQPTNKILKRIGAFNQQARVLQDRPVIDVTIPGIIFPRWCLCVVRGRLVKRVTLPDGSVVERPICNARVHVCEVDRVPWVIERLPDPEIWRLRDDLLKKLRVIPERIPRGPFPPEPDPRLRLSLSSVQTERNLSSMTAQRSIEQSSMAALSSAQQLSVTALTTSNSVSQIRRRLIDISSLITINLCDLIYLWPYFTTMDCLTDVHTDSNGRFSTTIIYDCADQPDLYFWVEQFQDGVWQTVYRPSVGCGTYWNYVCGTEIVINVPRAVACEDPTYDIPPGVTLFVLPYAIGSAPIWGEPFGSPPAPTGWVRTDGYINYTAPGLGAMVDAPFARTLNFIHDDSYFIPSSGIKYYRYSYQRVGDTAWTPITTPLSRGYRMEYSDRLPTYESYPVGPITVGGQSGLFEFKPLTPPVRPTDPPASVVMAREWTSGNLSEVAASWNTMGPAPPMSSSNITDDAGDFDIKIEVFSPTGALVLPSAATFQWLVRNANGTTTRLATAPEQSAGAYIFRVHVDNNNAEAELPQPSIGGISASDDCGFLRYDADDQVHIQFLAAHQNNHAVFTFDIKRGSNPLDSASTLPPFVEVAAAAAPTGTAGMPYNKVSGNYQRNFAPSELVGTCVNAAFAAELNVYGKATNGYERVGIHDRKLIAFALAETEEEEEDE